MNTYWFGKDLENHEWMLAESWSELRKLKKEFALTPSEKIIEVLHDFGQLWSENSELFQRALPQLIEESGFSEEQVIETLKLLPQLLNRESLETRINAEFTNKNVLDRFSKLPHSSCLVKAVPKGVVLHVTAGNVFLSSIDSLIMGFLTKNLSLLKVSSSNKFFPLYFAKALLEHDSDRILANKFSILHWKGGDQTIENFVKAKVDLIIAWGGEEMIRSYQRDLPQSVKVLDFGPKISFQVITKDSLENKSLKAVTEAIVKDIIPWDQAACASPQNLYLQHGVDEDSFMQALNDSFEAAKPRGDLSEDEAVEILKETYRGLYSELMEGGKLQTGTNHLLHLENNKFLRPSPLGRSLIIKRFRDVDDLSAHLEPFSYYLQSCSYLLSENETHLYLDSLALTGIKRFAPLGTITRGMDGAPHDGRFVLRELINFIGNEARIQDYGENHLEIQNSIKLKDHFENNPHPSGYIFSSGGTTGEPKFIHYSYEDFERLTEMIAHNLKVQGVGANTTVANLFVAGNLWSSFLLVDKALEKLGAIQLPIGGLCPSDNVISYLRKFKPECVMGLPSLLIMIAEKAASQGIELNIPKVFYAGEAMSETRRAYLKKLWGTKYFGSGGYASVDAGGIGYQCEYCEAGEHHLFTNMIHLKIINDEAIVSSLARQSHPINNYATGDRVAWVDGACGCGRADRKFKLLGRVDNIIQIWSCRLRLADIEKSLKNLDPSILSFQVQINEVKDEKSITDVMTLVYETTENKTLDPRLVIGEIYKNSKDLKDTISEEVFAKRVVIEAKMPGEIQRNPRTGKISVVVDQRN